VGRFFGLLFIFLGVLNVLVGDGLWITLIGFFLDNAAAAQVQQVMFQGLLEGHKVSQAMSSQCPAVPGDMTLQQLVDEHVLIGSRRGSSLYIRNFADFPKNTIPAVAQTFGETGPS